jgi:hypothetical protein
LKLKRFQKLKSRVLNPKIQNLRSKMKKPQAFFGLGTLEQDSIYCSAMTEQCPVNYSYNGR